MAKKELNEALFAAIEEGNAEAVKSAITAGADVNAKDDDGNMPLTLCNSAEIMKNLINAGADVNAKSDSEWPPLLEHSNDPELVKVLIDAGADINAKTKIGQSILHTCRNADLVKMLIDAGADVNAKDNDGNTPLHNRPDLSVAKLLIAAGADVNAKNNNGKIPLDVCLVAAVKKLLIKAAEAKDNAASTDKKTAAKKKAEPKFTIKESPSRRLVNGKMESFTEHRLDKVTLPKSFDGVLVIPEEVTQLGKLICQNMTQIKEVVLPENLLYLGNCTFAGCNNLEKINLPKGIQDLADSCFDGCTSLTELRIPAGARISGCNFVGLPSSTHIIIDEANPDAKIEEGAILSKDDKEFIRLLSDVENYEVKDGVTEIGGDAFNKRQNIKKIVLPASVKVIYNDFKGCPNLTTIVVKSEAVRDKVKKILDEHELDIDIELIEDETASHTSTKEEASQNNAKPRDAIMCIMGVMAKATESDDLVDPNDSEQNVEFNGGYRFWLPSAQGKWLFTAGFGLVDDEDAEIEDAHFIQAAYFGANGPKAFPCDRKDILFGNATIDEDDTIELGADTDYDRAVHDALEKEDFGLEAGTELDYRKEDTGYSLICRLTNCNDPDDVMDDMTGEYNVYHGAKKFIEGRSRRFGAGFAMIKKSELKRIDPQTFMGINLRYHKIKVDARFIEKDDNGVDRIDLRRFIAEGNAATETNWVYGDDSQMRYATAWAALPKNATKNKAKK